MTVREKMDILLEEANVNNIELLDCGIFNIDYRQKGFIQNFNDGKIIVVYESKDDIDNEGIPQIVVMPYDNLKELLGDYSLVY